MSQIMIDKTEYPELKDCEIGEPLRLNGTVTAIDGDQLTVEVSEAAYDEEVAEEPAPAPAKPSRSPVASIGIPMKKSYA